MTDSGWHALSLRRAWWREIVAHHAVPKASGRATHVFGRPYIDRYENHTTCGRPTPELVRKRIGKQTQEQGSGSCALRSPTSLRSLFTLCGGGRGRLSRTQARTWPVPGTLPTLLSPHFFGSTHPRDLIFSGVDTRTFRAVRNPLTRAYEAVGGSRRSFVKRGR